MPVVSAHSGSRRETAGSTLNIADLQGVKQFNSLKGVGPKGVQHARKFFSAPRVESPNATPVLFTVLEQISRELTNMGRGHQHLMGAPQDRISTNRGLS
eukprot:3172786-Pyramimonas_sp.AAC.1